ncbi:hypothetical protein ACPCBC_22245 [Streptomyces incarnatus]|nr:MULTISPECIES: hypothetical protein [Streptomyces]
MSEEPGVVLQLGQVEERCGQPPMACADHWGWQPSARFGERGKFVWCELGFGAFPALSPV